MLVLGASAGTGADVAHRTLYGIRTKVCVQAVQPLTQLSAKTEPEECKYATALIDKERPSDDAA